LLFLRPGNPEADVSWYKNNQAILENRKIKFLYEDDGVCSLVIRDITTQDRGKYKCVATNKKGKIQCSCELFVERKCEDSEDIWLW
jgi:hypothetical protein